MGEIGFIGLGKMGFPILKRLMSRFSVKMVYNRNKSKLTDLSGVKAADEPFQVASSCDIIFLMLSDDAACEAVIFGEKGLMRTIRPQSIVVNLGTVSHEFCMSASRRLQENLCSYVDAPVLGSVALAETGSLTTLASGPEKAFKTISNVIESYSGKVFYLGQQGNATKMKLISTMLMAVNLAAAGEALVMSDKAGISRENAIEILQNSGGESRILDAKKESVLSESYDPSFALKDMVKDLGYASSLSRNLSSPVTLGASATQFYLAAMSIGLGNLDFSSVVRVFKFMIGRG